MNCPELVAGLAGRLGAVAKPTASPERSTMQTLTVFLLGALARSGITSAVHARRVYAARRAAQARRDLRAVKRAAARHPARYGPHVAP